MEYPTSKSVFVGNLPYNYDEQSLVETLSMVGPVNNFRIVFDEATGKSKGFGFVEYKNIEIAMSALRNMKSIDYNGRQLRVNTPDNDKSFFVFAEDKIKTSKDIAFVKESESNINDTMKSLSDEQKFLIFQTFKSMNDNNPATFKTLLMNQSEEFLNSLLDVQLEFLNKQTGKSRNQTNKIV